MINNVHILNNYLIPFLDSREDGLEFITKKGKDLRNTDYILNYFSFYVFIKFYNKIKQFKDYITILATFP
jgi:hypothetical protein